VDQLLSNPFAATAIIVIATVGIAFIVCFLGYHWLQYRHAELEAALKQEMVQRGMTPDDILRVLKASRTDPQTQRQAGLAQHMVNMGLSADEIERVLKASRTAAAAPAEEKRVQETAEYQR